ncbi:MAG: imidazoleglycerol-phosphate dehydratase HisB [Pseudomonadota bacterium]|nr:imidazoleglycerol-phosphate dehydratase HisB [Pseudomonadota bacterium]MBU2026751.1 imidazoleglycerol-phosphate dehydratase HisB [Pseudomonadota bacterium]MBU2234608.1 imidazoleglycerol-phosphate dehydratase HisB [Pseudomonadota bacterium]MBU3930958.1 imidazoleglycerol-phosphate dehydratase HisB [Pseudomonadota bacterium]MBU4074737.1 imidazoleglycerol-phosphate dehydratase HisB [Pseudomonadota bacterium]
MMRKATIRRKTAETEVSVVIDLDGKGKGDIDTSVPFLDHMLNLFARHGLTDLAIRSQGDIDVDDHHLVEDVGICLGQAVRKALGDRKGISRYGSSSVPMDESLCSVAMDLSGRPYLVWRAELGERRIGEFDPALLREFFKSFSDHSGITLHINLSYGTNGHHMAEAIFKAFARAFRDAIAIDGRIEGILSTKGSLEV